MPKKIDDDGRPVKMTMDDRLNDQLDRLALNRRLGSWSHLVREVAGPPEIMAALATGRPELVRIAPARVLDERECAALYGLLSVLIETNDVLQEHARQVSILVNDWQQHLQGLVNVSRRITDFADFRLTGPDGDEEDEAA